MDKPGIGEITYSEELERIREKFKLIRPHKDNKRQSPNKPLLALLAISRCLKGLDRLATFEEISRELKPLLLEFSPYGSSPRPQYSFWRMRNDKIWEIPDFAKVSETKSGDAKIRSLEENHTEGGFPKTDFEVFRSNPEFAVSLACELVDMHFPETLRERILGATGVKEGVDQLQIDKRRIWVRQSVRDSKFRGQVLNAYDGCCAICSYSLRVYGDLTGLEAAHIKWHQHFGPDIVPNGIALCSISPQAFRRRRVYG